jgi:hypothetical protein
MRRRVVIAIAALLFAANVTPVLAKGGFGGSSSSGGSKSYSSGGGSKSSGSSSSASKSVGGSKVSVSSSPKNYSSSKGAVPTASTKAKIVPPTIKTPSFAKSTPGTRSLPKYVPTGRNYATDRTRLMRDDRYFVNTGPVYYGSYQSPFFYLWLAGAFDNNSGSRPPLPAAENKVAEVLPTLLGIIGAEVKEATP